MEHCSRGDFLTIIKEKTESSKNFTEAEAAKVCRKLFSAIAHCHSNGIAHRDIKPENIMIDQYGEIKIIDFGLSLKIH